MPPLSLFSVLCKVLLVGLLCFLGVFLEGSCNFCLLTGEFWDKLLGVLSCYPNLVGSAFIG